MRPYSEDIRLRVVHSYENHEGSQREIAARFQVSPSFVRDLLRRFRQTGSIAPKQYRGRIAKKIDDESLELLFHRLDQDPGLPLSHLCALLVQERQLRISRATLWRTIQKHLKEKLPPKGHSRIQREQSRRGVSM